LEFEFEYFETDRPNAIGFRNVRFAFGFNTMEQEEIGVKRTNGLNEDLHAIKIDQKHLYYSIYKSHTFTQGTFSSLF
jgi:hypothetical protein